MEKEYLKRLQKIKKDNENWANLLELFIKDKPDYSNSATEEINNFLRDASNYYNDNDENEFANDLEIEISDELLCKKIIKYISKSAIWLFDIYIIRKIECINQSLTKTIIDSIFYNVLLSYDSKHDKQIREVLKMASIDIEKNDKDTISNMIFVFKFLADKYIEFSLSKDEILEYTQNSCKISYDTAAYFANLLHENRIELKLNYIVENLHKDNDSLDIED